MSVEPWLSDHLPSGGRLALDIGANVGSYTRLLAERFDAVHAFEPGPASGELHRCCDGNERVRIIDAAVGARAGELNLKLYAHHTHASAFADDVLDTITRGASTGSMRVPVVASDELGYPLAPVDFVKIDTEGYECEVLQGARQTLELNMPALLVEIHADRNGVWCAQFLAELGYTLTRIAHPHAHVPPGHHWLAAPKGAR
jgi:FkbM family methyltransferase